MIAEQSYLVRKNSFQDESPFSIYGSGVLITWKSAETLHIITNSIHPQLWGKLNHFFFYLY